MGRGYDMVIAEYYRSLIRVRSLAPPWPMSGQEARRYRAWQRHTRRMRALDKCMHALRMLLVKRYNDELARINADDDVADTPDQARADGKAAFTRRSGGPYAVSPHFEAERWRRS